MEHKPFLSHKSASEKIYKFSILALSCAAVGVLLGLGISTVKEGSLYATSSRTIAARTTVSSRGIPSSVGKHHAPENRVLPAAAVNYIAKPSKEPASSTAVLAGLAVTALAALATVLRKYSGRKQCTTGLSQLEQAEAHWSIAAAAATAFVGTQAPDFTATAVFDEEFVEVQLSQYRGKQYVVLFFYPLDFTFVCPTEITAFSDRAAEFEAIDTQILGVSVDSQFSHLAWIQTPRNEGGLGEIKYPLVADLKKEIAEAYGVLTEEGIALRGLFIIDKEGVIQHATINNLAFGRSVDETLRVLEAVQHVQANPDEVCPAGWKKGDKTMKPDPEGSKEYFQAI